MLICSDLQYLNLTVLKLPDNIFLHFYLSAFHQLSSDLSVYICGCQSVGLMIEFHLLICVIDLMSVLRHCHVAVKAYSGTSAHSCLKVDSILHAVDNSFVK